MKAKFQKMAAVILALVLLFAMIPFAGIPATAESEQHPDTVTVTVTDANGYAVASAEVEYSIYSADAQGIIGQGTETTDEYGCAVVLNASDFVENDLTLTASVSKEGYVTDTSIGNTPIMSGTDDFPVVLQSSVQEVPGVSAAANELTYTGEPQSALTVNCLDGDTVGYSFNDEGITMTDGKPYVTDAGTYQIQVTITREGFSDYVNTVTVEVQKADITDVTFEAKDELVYTGEQMELVTLEGVLDTDIVTFTCENENVTLPTGEEGSVALPSATVAGAYQVKITVDRGDNYNVFEKEVTPEIVIRYVELGDLTITGLDGVYSGAPQQAVSLSEESEDYTLTYELYSSSGELLIDKTNNLEELVVTDAGAYRAVVTATKTNHTPTDVPVVAAPHAESISLELNVYLAKAAAPQYLVFNEEEYQNSTSTSVQLDTAQPAPELDFSASLFTAEQPAEEPSEGATEGATEGSTEGSTEVAPTEEPTEEPQPVDDGIVYSLSDGASASIDATGKLTINDACSFTVTATKHFDENHEDAVLSHKVYVSVTGENLITISDEPVQYTVEETGVVSTRQAVRNPQYEGKDTGAISYSFANGTPDFGLSCNSETGEVTVTDYATLFAALAASGEGSLSVQVIADKAESKQTVMENTVTSTTNMKTVLFSNNKNWTNVYFYWWKGSENNGWDNKEQATFFCKNSQQEDVYLCMIPDYAEGLIFHNGEGTQTVDITDIKDIYNYYPTDGSNKCAVGSSEWKGTENNNYTSYTADTAAYWITITSLPVPQNAYTLDATEGENDWYTSDVTVIPANGYTVSTSPDPAAFGATVTFSDQGTANRYVYLKSDENGGITQAIAVTRDGENVKIDKITPDAEKLTITFSDDVDSDKKDGYRFNKSETVTITFEIIDEDSADASEISRFNWSYTRQDGAVSAILADEIGELAAQKVAGRDNTYSAELILPKDEANQYRGHISVTASDAAGNTSESKTENSIVVVDTISPKMTEATHTLANPQQDQYHKIDDVHYYSGDVAFRFIIKEANFFSEDVTIYVTKDGEVIDLPEISWSSADDVNTGSFTLSGDGDYRVYLEYTDNSLNTITDQDDASYEENVYESEQITIDTTAPAVTCDFATENDYADQIVTFTVDEHNFRAIDISVVASVVDLNNNAQTVADINEFLHDPANWTQDEENPDLYTLTYDQLADGIYTYTVSYTDVAGNQADTVTKTFTVDHSAPTDPEITYSDPIRSDAIDESVLMFYNPTYPVEGTDQKFVTITFTSKDDFSGVSRFEWSYTRFNASLICAEVLEGEVDAAVAPADEEPDNSLFTASITLPEEVAMQLKGYISVQAIDNYENKSNTVDDTGKIIIVDSIAPQCTVRYSEPSREVGDNLYYGSNKNGEAQVIFTVNEANFFAGDVIVKVSKSGEEEEKQVYPVWTDITDEVTQKEMGLEGKDDRNDYHVGVITLSGDGHYIVSAAYMDRSNNEMTPFVSKRITLDTVAPVVEVQYHNSDVQEILPDSQGNTREYYATAQSATITVTEHNFIAEEVINSIIAQDVTGAHLSNPGLYTITDWTHEGDVHTIEITYFGDANYTFDVDVTDLAYNVAEDYAPNYFTVDATAPVVTGVAYSTSVLDTLIQNLTFGFYGAQMQVTVTATDDTAGVHGYVYSYRNASGVSAVNAELINQAIEEGTITYSADNRTATLVFTIPRDALGPNNQFNGTVDFSSTDRSHNEVKQQENRRVVVDNIAPTCTVEYNSPVNTRNGVSYYNGSIEGTITINEANFYSEDVAATYTANGAASTLPISWSDSSVDVHVGKFTLSADADYIIRISYKDRSGNAMADYTSGQLTIDTTHDDPVVTINGKDFTGDGNIGGAHKDAVSVSYEYFDQNLDTSNATLIRRRFDKSEDVTADFIHESGDSKSGSASFDIPRTTENDGVYVLTVQYTDLANHDASTEVMFTVNRFGSVYIYDDYLFSLIKDGGQYIGRSSSTGKAITKDIVITEYNADAIVDGSVNIFITRDSEPLTDVQYRVELQTTSSKNSWYENKYIISADNFEKDGVYRISLSSKDATANESNSVPENSFDSKNNSIVDSMRFTVDTSVPEIRNIINLDSRIINAQEIEVKYSIMDAGGLKSVVIMVDDEILDEIVDFDNLQVCDGSFIINEKDSSQNIRIIVTDLAGNVIDTASEDFSTNDMYTFYDTITVSTNFFVRWYASKALFYGSIIGAAAILVGLGFLIAHMSKKKK